jgi:phage-related protein
MISIFTVADWDGILSYSKNDIVKKDGLYYYAVKDVPAGATFSLSQWGGYVQLNQIQNKPYFLWKPSYNSPVDHAPRVKVIQFADGYEQRIPDGINNTLLTLNLNFELRDSNEARAILHFLYTRKAVETFAFTPPAPYADVKLFVCKEWTHNEVFFNNHSIRAKFEERAV